MEEHKAAGFDFASWHSVTVSNYTQTFAQIVFLESLHPVSTLLIRGGGGGGGGAGGGSCQATNLCSSSQSYHLTCLHSGHHVILSWLVLYKMIWVQIWHQMNKNFSKMFINYSSTSSVSKKQFLVMQGLKKNKQSFTLLVSFSLWL